MAWWWLLIAWPLVGLLAAAVFHVVVTRVPPDHCHELTLVQRAHLPGGHPLGLRRRPASRPPAGRPSGVSLVRRRSATTGAGLPSGLTRGPVRRVSLQAPLGSRRRRRTSRRTPLIRVPGAEAHACRAPRRTAGHAPAAARGAVSAAVLASTPSHRPSRSVRPPRAGSAPTAPTGRIRAWTRGGPARPGPRGRAPQRLLALTALSAIALAPVLARSGSTLGYSDPLRAELAAHPDQVSATFDALNRGAAMSGLPPIEIRDWPLPEGDQAPEEDGDRSPGGVTDRGPATSTTDSRRTDPRPTDSAPATSTGDAPTDGPTVPPVPVPGDRPPASDSPSDGDTRTTVPTPTGPADPTAPRPTPTPSPTDPEPTPTPTPTEPEPTPTPTDPEPTPTPTDPVPTPTPTDPEPTPTPTPTPTDPEPTPTDPADPTEPTPTPTPTDAEPTPGPTDDEAAPQP
ncbi:hypothetical protein GCM10023328_23670 [Modestobacter marinus]|uniref:Uncharacterized protein n=1 Tax=Modestobacter marinus TaxID=477641 RepID=A0A846LFB9_9ACTN|nr:hypothetical protein [Modestobacter marinus]GGL63133.1 hypothetical protein GCM10011589_19210 [Modestobacter marinus]